MSAYEEDFGPLAFHLGECKCPKADVSVTMIGVQTYCPLYGWMDMGPVGSLRIYKHHETREVLRLSLDGEVAP